MELGIQNAAALVPFFEMLYRQEQARQQGEAVPPIRVLHFGDSHTASDDWPNAARERLQQRFGSAGPGFVHAGRPFAGFRRFDARASMSRGWRTIGLLNREGDGLSGLSGVSIEAVRPNETITLEASGSQLEVLFLRQPGGGLFTVEVDGELLDTIDTAGEIGAGFWERDLPAGRHLITLRTVSAQPVRIQGWILESPGGITWETLGINGAQADLLLGWNPNVLKTHVARRDPSLIVLAYGTNEARRTDWTIESYREALVHLISLFREAAPTASILLIGAPDQMFRYPRRVTPVDRVSPIVAAQRDAALDTGCAFWNLRAAMGGRASMQQWVRAGLAQGDYVHLTADGYRLWGHALSDLLLGQYDIFLTVRRQVFEGSNSNGSPQQNP
jgi:lysophospholipase L1-like esterase